MIAAAAGAAANGVAEKTCLCVLNKIGVAKFSVIGNNRPTDYFYVELYFESCLLSKTHQHKFCVHTHDMIQFYF